MLARYRIVRGQRPPDDPLPKGRRLDTRKHTQHCLRPSAESVETLLEDPSPQAFERFAREYRATLTQRYAADRQPFDELAQAAMHEDVYLGCNCPTRWNPDVNHCHTVLALSFMKQKYPKLVVKFPSSGRER